PVRPSAPTLMAASLISPAPALVAQPPSPTALRAAPSLDAGTARGTRRAWRWGTAGTGVALAAGAAVLYGWNEQRYRAWIRTDDELAHAPYATPDVLARQSDNDARLRSIHAVDWV